METRIGIIGLGYVGLPLAVEFARKFPVIGLDINPRRVAELSEGLDGTGEVAADELAAAENLQVTSEPADLADCNVYIITVPTPVDEAQRPDLRPLQSASRTVGGLLKPGDTVIYESTVYPGTTEEECIPILEAESGLKCAFGNQTHPAEDAGATGRGQIRGNEFFVGYSPERINPGDRQHRLSDIRKVTSGSTPGAAEAVDNLYASIITAGTHKAPSIKVAEASKVIENTQRDVNIALMNELAMVFDRMNIDTAHVLEAAGTKWNFLPFRPGLVGGHCIGVDPYYLTHKATILGHNPELTLASRRINDKMAIFVANKLMRLMARKGIPLPGSRILVLGLTFKEDCPDLRNTKVIDLVRELQACNAVVDVHDPHADADEARDHFGIELTTHPEKDAYDAVVLAVAHREFRQLAESEILGWARE
ncbi:MAG: nucleotide sugar dehydrogenase, partial [Wenzhouxiangellaceae bacterium]